MAKNPSTLPSNFASAGTVIPEDGYLFKDSGLPTDIANIGKISISGTSRTAGIVAGDAVRREYGTVFLKDIGNAYDFTIRAPLTGAANTANLEAQQVRIALRDTGGASSLVFFVKTSLGNSLSGELTLGPTI